MDMPAWKDREARARAAVRRAKQQHPELFTREGNREFHRAHMQQCDTKKLIEFAAQGSNMAVEILRERAIAAARTGENVPDEFHEFVWAFFVNDGPPRRLINADGKVKAIPKTMPTDTDLTYRTIALLVKIVHQEFEFPVYRSSEHRGSTGAPPSAISIVADEVGLSEQRVEQIWHEWGGARVGVNP